MIKDEYNDLGDKWYKEVLDHGFVRLVDFMGSDLAISRSARVSHNAEARPEDAKLINYLWEHHHTTPFEAVTFTFEVKAPILVFRQWHRHRTWSYNEVSARYTELPEEFYIPTFDQIQRQSKSNKQGKEDDQPYTDLEKAEIQKYFVNSSKACFREYQGLLKLGLTRELARSVLPVNTYSHMFATVNLCNLFKFLTLRCDKHAQYEIRVYAKAMLELIKLVVPNAVFAWEMEQGRG